MRNERQGLELLHNLDDELYGQELYGTLRTCNDVGDVVHVIRALR